MFGNHDCIAGIIIFAACALLFYHTFYFPTESAQFPRVVLFIMLLLSGWMVLRSFILVDWRNMSYASFFIHGGRLALAIAMMGLYILAINYLGYYTASIIYIPTMALLLGYRSKIVIVLSTVCYLAIVLGVFDILFERQLPKEFFML